MTRGVTFASLGSLGIGAVPRITRRARALGFDSAWVAETTGGEAFATLATAAAASPGIGLGTGVLALQLRTPMLAAMGAATLAAGVDAGPVYLGIGISSPVVVSDWHGVEYGDRPVARVREYLTLVRECLAGESVTFDGDYWSCRRFRLGVRLTPEQRPRLVVGALNPTMLRTAGELADGVLLNYLPATAVPWCIDRVREGERLAGRPAGSCRVHAYVHVGVCDPEAARDAARKDLFSYAVVPAYARAFGRAGFFEEVSACRAAHAARDRDGAVAAISDAMVDAINRCGAPDEVARFVAEYEAAGVDDVVIMALPWGPDRAAVLDATLTATAPDLAAGER